jgi:hypothetical protein
MLRGVRNGVFRSWQPSPFPTCTHSSCRLRLPGTIYLGLSYFGRCRSRCCRTKLSSCTKILPFCLLKYLCVKWSNAVLRVNSSSLKGFEPPLSRSSIPCQVDLQRSEPGFDMPSSEFHQFQDVGLSPEAVSSPLLATVDSSLLGTFIHLTSISLWPESGKLSVKQGLLDDKQCRHAVILQC